MKPEITLLSKTEFHTFLLICAASADFHISHEEKEAILRVVDKPEYHSVKKLFEQYNDNERLQVILLNKNKYFADSKDVNALLNEMKYIFMADHEFAAVEKAILVMLRRVMEVE